MSEVLLQVRIIAKNKVLFKGQARSVSSHNAVGNFDILPEHSSFISLIDKSVGYVDELGISQVLSINQGLIKVINNQVIILVELAS